jgi:hypothetical protein
LRRDVGHAAGIDSRRQGLQDRPSQLERYRREGIACGMEASCPISWVDISRGQHLRHEPLHATQLELGRRPVTKKSTGPGPKEGTVSREHIEGTVHHRIRSIEDVPQEAPVEVHQGLVKDGGLRAEVMVHEAIVDPCCGSKLTPSYRSFETRLEKRFGRVQQALATAVTRRRLIDRTSRLDPCWKEWEGRYVGQGANPVAEPSPTRAPVFIADSESPTERIGEDQSAQRGRYPRRCYRGLERRVTIWANRRQPTTDQLDGPTISEDAELDGTGVEQDLRDGAPELRVVGGCERVGQVARVVERLLDEAIPLLLDGERYETVDRSEHLLDLGMVYLSGTSDGSTRYR